MARRRERVQRQSYWVRQAVPVWSTRWAIRAASRTSAEQRGAQRARDQVRRTSDHGRESEHPAARLHPPQSDAAPVLVEVPVDVFDEVPRPLAYQRDCRASPRPCGDRRLRPAPRRRPAR
jgi:hypothetical protein